MLSPTSTVRAPFADTVDIEAILPIVIDRVDAQASTHSACNVGRCTNPVNVVSSPIAHSRSGALPEGNSYSSANAGGVTRLKTTPSRQIAART